MTETKPYTTVHTVSTDDNGMRVTELQTLQTVPAALSQKLTDHDMARHRARDMGDAA